VLRIRAIEVVEGIPLTRASESVLASIAQYEQPPVLRGSCRIPIVPHQSSSAPLGYSQYDSHPASAYCIRFVEIGTPRRSQVQQVRNLLKRLLVCLLHRASLRNLQKCGHGPNRVIHQVILLLGSLLFAHVSCREHHLLFGAEIGEYIQELYKRGLRLHTIHQMSGPQHVIRPEDIEIDTQIIEWFSGQTRVAEQKFLKYIDFREA